MRDLCLCDKKLKSKGEVTRSRRYNKSKEQHTTSTISAVRQQSWRGGSERERRQRWREGRKNRRRGKEKTKISYATLTLSLTCRKGLTLGQLNTLQ